MAIRVGPETVPPGRRFRTSVACRMRMLVSSRCSISTSAGGLGKCSVMNLRSSAFVLAGLSGAQLVAACDLAVAANEATFGTSGITNGLFCGSPSVPVGRNVGSKRALDMLFTGQSIDAATALRDGLVSRVAPPDKLDQ